VPQPVLTLVAGPNGSGKTTALAFLRDAGIEIADYHNADDEARRRVERGRTQAEAEREAQLAVRKAREAAIAARRSFSYETVMPHPSHVDAMRRAREAGFFVRLIFVTTDSAEMQVARVRQRVRMGGHAVPEDRIVARYGRIHGGRLADALVVADEAMLFDTTCERAPGVPGVRLVGHLIGFALSIWRPGALRWADALEGRLRLDGRFALPD
jgi:predicted ABC-type ATPase